MGLLATGEYENVRGRARVQKESVLCSHEYVGTNVFVRIECGTLTREEN